MNTNQSFVDDKGEMAELERPDAGHGGLLAGDRGLLGIDLDGGALRVLERHRLRNAGAGVVARLAAHAFGLDALADVVELGARRDLEGEPRAARHIALLELDREIAHLGREVRAAVLPLRQDQSDDLREIVDLPVEVRCFEGRVADPLDVNHSGLQFHSRDRACASAVMLSLGSATNWQDKLCGSPGSTARAAAKTPRSSTG
jgi:hypothetical protein